MADEVVEALVIESGFEVGEEFEVEGCGAWTEVVVCGAGGGTRSLGGSVGRGVDRSVGGSAWDAVGRVGEVVVVPVGSVGGGRRRLYVDRL